MRIIKREPLIEFWELHADAEQPLKSWFAEAKKAEWKKPADIKALYGNASILPNNRVVFNIGGSKYRLVVKLNFHCGIVFIRWIGTHKDYDDIDAETI